MNNEEYIVLTVGETAQLCQVDSSTVIRWFDAEKLKGYRIPGTMDRRIPLPELNKFRESLGAPPITVDHVKTMRDKTPA